MTGILEKIIEPKFQIEDSRKRFTTKQLIQLIGPLIIEQFLSMLIGLVDTMMISYAGDEAVSGVSLVNQMNYIFILAFSALSSGGAVVASQYVGKKDKENGTKAASQLVMLSTMVSVVITILLFFFGDKVLELFFSKVEEGVFHAGHTYLMLLVCSYPFVAIYNGCAGLFRSMGKTKTLMIVSVIMNVINVVGNAICIFGLNWGVEGVAIPSLISRFVAAVIMVILAFDQDNAIYIKIREIFSWNAGMIKRILRIAIPNSIESVLSAGTKVALTTILATFGTAQIAAYGVANSFFTVSSLFCLGMQPAFVTVVGQYMGAGDTEGADYYMKKMLRFTYLGAVIWDLFWIALLPLLIKFYDLSADVLQLAVMIVVIHNIFDFIFDPWAYSVSSGLRAAGDLKYTMFATVFASAVVRVAVSILLGVVLKWGAIGLAIAMVTDWFTKGVLILLRYRSGKWKCFKVI